MHPADVLVELPLQVVCTGETAWAAGRAVKNPIIAKAKTPNNMAPPNRRRSLFPPAVRDRSIVFISWARALSLINISNVRYLPQKDTCQRVVVGPVEEVLSQFFFLHAHPVTREIRALLRRNHQGVRWLSDLSRLGPRLPPAARKTEITDGSRN